MALSLPDAVIAAVVTTVVIIVGWYVVHYLTGKRDQANKRRELRVQYLIEAYRRLEFAGNRPLTKEVAPEFEKAIADIQLFGTPKQVELAQAFALGFAKNGMHSLDPLLNELRQELRRELNLESVQPSIKYLRISYDKKQKA
jgi:hypothetical protein